MSRYVLIRIIECKNIAEKNLVKVKTLDELKKAIKDKKIAEAPMCNSTECEDYIKDKTEGATSRLIPLEEHKNPNKCIHCGKEGKYMVYFAKAY